MLTAASFLHWKIGAYHLQRQQSAITIFMHMQHLQQYIMVYQRGLIVKFLRTII